MGFKEFINQAIADKSNNTFNKYNVSDKNIKLIRDAQKKSKLAKVKPKKKSQSKTLLARNTNNNNSKSLLGG
tara:strand:+ start:249 stop:464 length:216 start_codon:yes stop_codon:yes gene_type:complete